jgi:hypothetical protein
MRRHARSCQRSENLFCRCAQHLNEPGQACRDDDRREPAATAALAVTAVVSSGWYCCCVYATAWSAGLQLPNVARSLPAPGKSHRFPSGGRATTLTMSQHVRCPWCGLLAQAAHEHDTACVAALKAAIIDAHRVSST